MPNPPDIQGFIQRFQQRLTAKKRAVLLKLFRSVIMDTPVLTGRLRGNWQFSKTTPIQTPLTTEDKGGGATINKVTAGVTAEVHWEDGEYMITNNMPYVIPIEYSGHSHTKAPQGMVRRNLIRIAALLRAEAQNR